MDSLIKINTYIENTLHHENCKYLNFLNDSIQNIIYHLNELIIKDDFENFDIDNYNSEFFKTKFIEAIKNYKLHQFNLIKIIIKIKKFNLIFIFDYCIKK